MRLKKLILGATCWGIGHLLREEDGVMAIGREGALGEEFFSSFALQSQWWPENSTGPLAEMEQIIREREIVTPTAGDVFRMAPVFYRFAETLIPKIIMMADIIAIEKTGSGWTVTYHHAGGTSSCQADMLVDTTARGLRHDPVNRENLTGRALNAVLAGSGTINQTGKVITSPGSSDTERFASVPVAVDADWTSLRRCWRQEMATWIAANPGWRVASVARETTYTFRQSEFALAPGFLRRISAACGGPLQAAAAGYRTEL